MRDRPQPAPSRAVHYAALGYRVIPGRLGNSDVQVAISPHADGRMILRDVTDHDLLELLERPISSHSPGQEPGRREVRKKIGNRVLVVVYSRPETAWVEIITVTQE